MENVGNKRDIALRQRPVSFITAYQYVYLNGIVGNWIGGDTYWENNTYSAISAMNLRFYSVYLLLQSFDAKGYGFSLRCLVR